jgi:hypothetical protein
MTTEVEKIIADNQLEKDIGKLRAELLLEGNVRIEASSEAQPYYVNGIDRDRWNEVWSGRAKEEGVHYWERPGDERVFFSDVWGVEGKPSFELVKAVTRKMNELTKKYYESARRYNETVANFIAERRALVDRVVEA